MDLTTIKFKSGEYVQCADVMEKAPIYSKGSRNTRTLIKKKEIPENMIMYAKQNEEGKWIKTTGESIKFDKVLLKKEYLINIPELQEKNEDTVIVDEKGIPEAPSIINLTNDEKFKDTDGNVVEIETRGERIHNGIYFKVKDVEIKFDQKQLSVIICNKNTGYEKDTDYCFFNCKVNNNVMKKNKKETIKKEMFLTYCGMLKVLFVSRSGKASGFIKWAIETLFTVQMGTKDQKQVLGSKLLGVSTDDVKIVFNTSLSTTPCIYFIILGTVGELREIMNIDMKYPDNMIVAKFGRANDMPDRISQHENDYGKIKGVELRLKYFGYVDPQHAVKAEAEVRDFFTEMESKLEYDGRKELVVIRSSMLKQVKNLYKNISSAYAGHVKDLLLEIKELEAKNQLIKRDMDLEKERYQNTLQEEKHKNILQEEMHKNILQEEKHKNALLIKDMEYMKIINELLMKK